jgi:diaminopimelate epimerase
MIGQFIKMHGLGNDFVVIDAREVAADGVAADAQILMTPARARAIADRRTGIGCDQLIILSPSTIADVRMRIWNADGSEVESCGNATRCVASLIGQDALIETAGGLLSASVSATASTPASTKVSGGALVSIDFPPPRFEWDAIPLAYPMDTRAMPLAWDGLSAPVAVNVGNPHAIFFVDDCAACPLEQLGPVIEHDAVFPDRINVNVATVTAPHAITLRVWERGVGLTRACGTGAIATAAAAIATRRAVSPVTVSLPGGDLIIEWSGKSADAITMRGPATEVFRGTTDWARFG